jgi:hypothetical protein
MTTNQIIAMFFPLFTAAVVALVVLFIRRPWAEKRDSEILTSGTRTVYDVEVVEALEEADRLIRRAISQVKAPVQ